LVELDVSSEAMEEACRGVIEPPFVAGERVRLTSSYGRRLSTPEEAVILGVREGRVWYSVLTVSSHEGFDEGATWAWYWTGSDLTSIQRIPNILRPAHLMSAVPCASFDEFTALVQGASRSADCDLTRQVNQRLRAQSDGFDFGNLSSVDFDGQLLPRLSVLRFLNCMVRRALPLIATEGQLGSMLKDAKGYIFTSTKRSFFQSSLRLTTTPTTLSSEEYVDPPQIRTVSINRIRATAAKLASVASSSKRIKRSVFGQMYYEMHKWSDHSFRRSYCGKVVF